MSIVEIFLHLLALAPELVPDAESIVNAVAHGEGGVQKVENAVAGVQHLATHLAPALATISTPQAG